MPLIDQAVFPKGKAVVAHVDDDGVFVQAVFLEEIEHSADTFVYAAEGFAIGAEEGIKIVATVIHIIHPMPAVALIFYPVGPVVFDVGLVAGLFVCRGKNKGFLLVIS